MEESQTESPQEPLEFSLDESQEMLLEESQGEPLEGILKGPLVVSQEEWLGV